MNILFPVGPVLAKRYKLYWRGLYGAAVGTHRWQREFYMRRQVDASGGIDAVEIRRFYNFGNAVRQLVNAIDFCSSHGIRFLLVPEQKWLRGGEVCGVDLRLPTDGPPRNALVGTFFYPNLVGVVWEPARRARILYELRRCILVRPAARSFDLVIHLRSGDVFEAEPHPGYWPPPLTYFISAIEHSESRDVCIVSQDDRHPYIPFLLAIAKERGWRIQVQMSSLLSDLGTLLSAQQLCLSQGTMALACAWLSNAVRKVYVPEGMEEVSELQALGINVLKASYARPVVHGPWRGSPDQLSDLLARNNACSFRGQ